MGQMAVMLSRSGNVTPGPLSVVDSTDALTWALAVLSGPAGAGAGAGVVGVVVLKAHVGVAAASRKTARRAENGAGLR